MRLDAQPWFGIPQTRPVEIGERRYANVEREYYEDENGQASRVAAILDRYESGTVCWYFGVRHVEDVNGDVFLPKPIDEFTDAELIGLGNVAGRLQDRLTGLGCNVDFSAGISNTGIAIGRPIETLQMLG